MYYCLSLLSCFLTRIETLLSLFTKRYLGKIVSNIVRLYGEGACIIEMLNSICLFLLLDVSPVMPSMIPLIPTVLMSISLLNWNYSTLNLSLFLCNYPIKKSFARLLHTLKLLLSIPYQMSDSVLLMIIYFG
jgi:hypothetical protein